MRKDMYYFSIIRNFFKENDDKGQRIHLLRQVIHLCGQRKHSFFGKSHRISTMTIPICRNSHCRPTASTPSFWNCLCISTVTTSVRENSDQRASMSTPVFESTVWTLSKTFLADKTSVWIFSETFPVVWNYAWTFARTTPIIGSNVCAFLTIIAFSVRYFTLSVTGCKRNDTT